ncbi:type A2 lantipeptide [Streptomyces sp. NPDC056244]|uniref:type A2 lantipeptide n=1 Tax=unclassified Streptomyces TaxID=2593676 RepID=UPI0035D95F1F
MNSTPQVATQEISDADLDNVSGGLLGGVIGTAVGTVDSIVPVSGTVGMVTGTVDSVTGANTSGALGVVGGL